MNDTYSEKPWLKQYDKNVAPKLEYEEKCFAGKFAEIVAKYPDKTALIYMGARISFRELDALSNRLANYLIKSGLKPDDVVGLHLPNIPAHYIGVIGVQKAGCVSTGLSPLLTAPEMEHQLKDSGTKVVLTVDVLYAKIAEVGGKAPFSTVIVSEIADFLPGVKRVLGKLLKKIPTAEVGPIQGKKVVRFMDVMKESPADPVAVKRGFDDMIFMMYTGGTTGPSKGAVLTQRSYMSNRQQVMEWLDISPEDLVLSAFPLFHIAGLAIGGFSMIRGCTQICVPNPRDALFLINALKSYRPTIFVNVPTVFFELLKRPEFRSLKLREHLKWCLSAAAPFPAEYVKDLESVIGEGNFIELYGMTETSPVTICNPRYGKKKPSSIGMPVSDTDVKLIDPESNQPAKPGEPGEIVIRGPQLMRGYHNKPGETKNAIRDGWMYTGDVAKMDEDGYFYIVDRVKDMVIVSGFKVFTREVDEVLAKHPDVELGASIGLPDPERPGSERVVCAIVLKPGVEKSDAEKAKILQFLKEKIAPYKVPKVIEFMDQLPTSGVGKILKREIKRMMMEGRS
ncbi:MAG TPA: AMP-binding protein [Spirochaetota bacterium]|nr:AMP-binding protein [Spirochaetota bacterium]